MLYKLLRMIIVFWLVLQFIGYQRELGVIRYMTDISAKNYVVLT